MISRIAVSDFQSIRSLNVECGRITVFFGESDQGKSAIVRALRGMAFNDWPSDHVTHGASRSKVGVEIDRGNGAAAVRIFARKGGGANGYSLQNGEGEFLFDRVGRDVPQPVAEALGWRAVELDDGSRFYPSFQGQFDEPFLVTSSPAKAAKVLGGLTNIATLYSAIRLGSNEERSARRSSDEARERVLAFDARIEEAQASLEVAARLLESLEVLVEVVQRRQVALDRLEGLSGAAEAARAAYAVAEASVAAVRVPDVPAISGRLDQLRFMVNLLVVHESAAQAIEGRGSVVDGRRSALADADAALEVFKKETGVCPVCGASWDG